MAAVPRLQDNSVNPISQTNTNRKPVADVVQLFQTAAGGAMNQPNYDLPIGRFQIYMRTLAESDNTEFLKTELKKALNEYSIDQAESILRLAIIVTYLAEWAIHPSEAIGEDIRFRLWKLTFNTGENFFPLLASRLVLDMNGIIRKTSMTLEEKVTIRDIIEGLMTILDTM